MPSVRSLQAAEAHRAGADVAADAAALVAERYRQQLVDVLAPAMETQRRQLQQIATGILAPAMETQRRQLQQIATGILAPAMETQRRQLQQIATGILAPAMETQRRQLQQIATGILAPAMETQRRQLQQIATGMSRPPTFSPHQLHQPSSKQTAYDVASSEAIGLARHDDRGHRFPCPGIPGRQAGERSGGSVAEPALCYRVLVSASLRTLEVALQGAHTAH